MLSSEISPTRTEYSPEYITPTHAKSTQKIIVLLCILVSSTGENVVHWFRKDLRLHDNPALAEGWRKGGNFYGVYIFDPLVFQDNNSSVNHGKFLLQCLRDLDAKLRECGSFLYIIRDSPMAAFKQVFGNWSVTKLTMEEDTEPYAKKLEDSVVALAGKYSIRVVTKVSHTLYSIPK
jgi:cryptochrome